MPCVGEGWVAGNMCCVCGVEGRQQDLSEKQISMSRYEEGTRPFRDLSHDCNAS